MEKLIIEGGHQLRGEIPVSGSKNTALTLMSAALLADGPLELTNIPALRDIYTFSKVIGFTGTQINYDAESHTLHIDPSTLNRFEAPYELVKKMRASFYMLGALLGKGGTARVSLPGGCAWGPRPVDLHLKGLEALGAEIKFEHGYVVASAPGGRLRGGVFRFEPSSVGATVNLLLGAVTARGYSRLENAACEPDVVVFCEMLKAMGAQIEGIGSHTLEIEGVSALHAADFRNCPDRIELGTFMMTAAMAGSAGETLRIVDAEPLHLGDAFLSAFAKTGTSFSWGKNFIEVVTPEVIQSVNVDTGIYPGFPTDLQAQWTVMMTQAQGNSKLRDTVYTDRFKHIPELMRMGANAIVVGNEVVIQGNTTLQGTHVMSTDLRASVSLVMGGLVAEGETHVHRIYHLDRGYEDIEGKLSALGAVIRREAYDEWAEPDEGA
ncbi:MAG: UDP-N-acetylglucosamine 1-carboxyvinyltransferase [Rhodothermia bacterium]|nr:UDP-N-acetylglucosamine 1-carboxyvinyltransferase [Rhodothermia bacterium]